MSLTAIKGKSVVLSGVTLKAVRSALVLAKAELHNQIATCPDVIGYAEDIRELNKERDYISQLISQMDAVIGKGDR